jgi:hypothetical protein
MQPDLDPKPPYQASVSLLVTFHHTVTNAENLEAANAIVTRQAEIFANTAREEALRCGATAEIVYQVVG